MPFGCTKDHENKDKKINPPLRSSQEGNKKKNIESFSKKFPSNGGVSRSDGVGQDLSNIIFPE